MVATASAISPEPVLTPHNAAVELRHFCGPALLGLWHFTRRKAVTLGERHPCDVFLSSEGLPTDRFPLVRYEAPDYVLCVATAMHGEIEVDGALQDLQAYTAAHGHTEPDLEATRTLVLQPSMRVLVHWSGTQLAMRLCAAPPPLLGRGRIWDAAYLHALIAAFTLHLVCIAALLLAPEVPAALSRPVFDDQRLAELLPLLPKPHPEPKPKPGLTPAPAAPSTRPAPAPLPARPAPTPPARGLGSVSHPAAPARGLQPLLGMLRAGAIAGGAPHGSLDRVWASDPADPRAHEPGLPGGLRPGPAGLPGAPPQSLPLGVPMPSLPSGQLPGPPRPLSGRRRDPDLLSLEPVRVEGALARELIQAVIDAQRAQVRYCYEQSLQRHPDLQGRILIAWTIGADGRVLAVRVEESTLTGDDGAVAACLLARIGAWRFPPPAGGGTVGVRYPFVFRAS